METFARVLEREFPLVYSLQQWRNHYYTLANAYNCSLLLGRCRTQNRRGFNVSDLCAVAKRAATRTKTAFTNKLPNSNANAFFTHKIQPEKNDYISRHKQINFI